MKIYALESIYGKNKKGYYGKAVVIETESGVYLQSYNTIVCGIVEGEIVSYWPGYSATTMQHINDFLKQNGFDGLTKSDWLALQTAKAPIDRINLNYAIAPQYISL